MADGHVNKCKSCNRQDVASNRKKKLNYYRQYDKVRQTRSFDRIFSHRYSALVQRAEGRASRSYRITGMPVLSRAEWDKWAIDNMGTFLRLYEQWEHHDFDHKYAPSVDRMDNSLGYTADNIQWLTVSDNSHKYTKAEG